MTALAGKLRRAIQVRRVQFFELLGPDAILPAKARAELEVVPVTPENVARVRDFRDAHIAAMFRRFLDEGQHGAYAVAGERVVGHVWAAVSSGERRWVNGYIPIGPGEAAIHFGGVDPALRGKGIYQTALAALCTRLFAEGEVRRVVSDCELALPAARRAHEKVGFRPTTRLLFVKVGRWCVYRKLLPAAAGEEE